MFWHSTENMQWREAESENQSIDVLRYFLSYLNLSSSQQVKFYQPQEKHSKFDPLSTASSCQEHCIEDLSGRNQHSPCNCKLYLR